MEVLVSIITPCYNDGKYLDEAIESIAAITTPYGFEHIIINDGSTDVYTLQKLKELEGRGYHIIHQPNAGLATARNNAIAVAKGKYILPLDADNKLHANYLTEAITLLEKNNETDIVYGNAIVFGEGSRHIPMEDFNLIRMLHDNYIDACAIFKKAVWEITGGYDPNMPGMGNEDWDFWMHCYFKNARFFHLDQPCYYYRVTGKSMSHTVTIHSFDVNRTYILKKYAKDITDSLLYVNRTNSHINNYIQSHRFKAIIKLLFNKKL